MARNTQILIAEDDANIRLGLVDTLESENYTVTAAVNGAEALRHFRKGSFDLVVLDLMMPEVSGYDVCREIRRKNERVPVLMLTAKGEEIDKVVGFELGADDYMTKPFGVRELLARIAAMLRRARLGMPAAKGVAASLPGVFTIGPASIDRKRYEATIAGTATTLTARELKLLEIFHEHPDEVLSRDFLLDAAWGVDYLGTTRTLDQHIAQLRKKIEPEVHPTVIVTVHGVGYRYHSA